jgi:general secretion pathway protein D
VLFGTKLRQSTPFTSLTNLSQFSGFLAGLQGPNIPELERLGLPVPQFGVVIHALQQSSDVNVLSTPHILASDNEEAEITVGQNVPFQAGFAPGNLGALGATGATGATGGVGGIGGLAGLGLGGLGSFFAPIQRQNVELKLTVKPHINKSDEIRMVINEQTEEIASQDPVLGPTTSKRSAKTTVIAKDQETVVLGGIMQDRTIESVTKVPVLGDIPILGHLFRDQTRKKVKTNLLLFLTPYIIKDRSDFRRIFERKMKERQQFIELFYGQVPGYDVAIDFGRKSGPVARVAQMIRQEEQKLENGGPGLPGERMITPAAPVIAPPAQAPRSGGEPTAPSPGSFAPTDAPAAGPSQPVPMEQIDPKSDGREAQNPADGSPSMQPADQPAPDRPTAPRTKLPADDKP